MLYLLSATKSYHPSLTNWGTGNNTDETKGKGRLSFFAISNAASDLRWNLSDSTNTMELMSSGLLPQLSRSSLPGGLWSAPKRNTLLESHLRTKSIPPLQKLQTPSKRMIGLGSLAKYLDRLARGAARGAEAAAALEATKRGLRRFIRAFIARQRKMNTICSASSKSDNVLRIYRGSIGLLMY